MKRKLAYILIALCLLCLLPLPAVQGDEEHPIVMRIEPDPECMLTQAGELSFLRFVLQNESEEGYTLYNARLTGQLLGEGMSLQEDIELEPKGVREFKVQNLYIPLNGFMRELSFTLSWQERYYLPEDTEQSTPLYTPRFCEATVLIELYEEPVLKLTVELEEGLYSKGEEVKLRYLLVNDTKFDMSGLTLYDPEVSSGFLPLEDNQLLAGESMELEYTLTMGEVDVRVNPLAEYSVKGEKRTVNCETSYTVGYMKVALDIAVEQFPATEEGTLFALTAKNSGTHALRQIHLQDEIGTPIGSGFDLAPGESKSLTYTVEAAASADFVRDVSFLAEAVDYLNRAYSYRTPHSYPVLPYVSQAQVQLSLSLRLMDTTPQSDGSIVTRILFEIRNFSSVPITAGELRENSLFNATVKSYEQLNRGVTSFYQDFTVPPNTQQMSFRLEAQDPSGTRYGSEDMVLPLGQLFVKGEESSGKAPQVSTVELEGGILDTERLQGVLGQGLLFVLALAFILVAGSLLLFVYELQLKKLLPQKELSLVIPGEERSGIHVRYGATQPARLRYRAVQPSPQQGAVKPTAEDNTAFRRPKTPAVPPKKEIGASPSQQETAMFTPVKSRAPLEGDTKPIPTEKKREDPTPPSKEIQQPDSTVKEEGPADSAPPREPAIEPASEQEKATEEEKSMALTEVHREEPAAEPEPDRHPAEREPEEETAEQSAAVMAAEACKPLEAEFVEAPPAKEEPALEKEEDWKEAEAAEKPETEEEQPVEQMAPEAETVLEAEKIRASASVLELKARPKRRVKEPEEPLWIRPRS